MNFKFDDSQIHPAIREAADLRGQMVQQTSSSLAKQLDDEFRRVADERMPEGWTMEDIAERFHVVTFAGRPGYEEIHFDGQPVFALGPLEMTAEQKGDSWIQTFTRSVKRFR